MIYQPPPLHTCGVLPATEALIALPVAVVHPMHQIEVEVVYTRTVKLFFKRRVHILTALEKIMRHLCRQRKAFARIALHERVPDCAFGVAVVVNVSGIEIGKARVKKAVHQPV